MKTRQSYILPYIILVFIQMIICNYFHLSSFITLSILPVMVLCIPLSVSTIGAMLIAFVTGLSIDLMAEGIYGLNTVALLPIAYIRKQLVATIFGKDCILRDEDFSFHKNGAGKITLAITIVQALFLILYIAFDGAGTRTFLFNLARFGASLAVGIIISLIVAAVITPEDRR